jgi:hypothetical protein
MKNKLRSCFTGIPFVYYLNFSLLQVNIGRGAQDRFGQIPDTASVTG